MIQACGKEIKACGGCCLALCTLHHVPAVQQLWRLLLVPGACMMRARAGWYLLRLGTRSESFVPRLWQVLHAAASGCCSTCAVLCVLCLHICVICVC